MSAVYHDTAELTLFRWGITLRRREGGGDEGWHMKLPVAGADGSSRDEMGMPLAAGAIGSVPPELLEIVSPLLRERPVTALLTLQTERSPILLFGDDGTALAELVDDTVSIFHNGRVTSVFREIEVEVLDPDLSRRLGCCVPPEIDSRIDFITSENVDHVSLGLSVI